jgi:hypothetical protein
LVLALIAVCCAAHAVAASAGADIFYLKNGDKFEAEILKDLGDKYRVLTLLGLDDVKKSEIVKREKRLTPWQIYKKKHRRTPKTAEGHFKLAMWCRKHKLNAEAYHHLEIAIKLDPEHADARAALRHVKKDGAWVGPGKRSGLSPEELEDKRRAEAEERLVRKRIREWFTKIRGIYRARLASGGGSGGTGAGAAAQAASFRKGREMILAIDDTLALPALIEVLSAGNVPTREILVEALSKFDEDEATMNLVALALLDRSAEIRKLAAQALLSRDDPRIVNSLREALRSEEEFILRHAAVALGVLKARQAVEDLIQVLSTQTEAWVRVSRPVFFSGLGYSFCGLSRCAVGRRFVRYVPPLNPPFNGFMVGTQSDYDIQTVSVYRTEVQEALIAITGQNLGFDEAAWRQWLRDQEE